MARQLLIETKMNSLSLQEGLQSKNPHCLGTIKGPCADFKAKTRNGNFYSRRLWENVFKDPLVKESLEDNVLIGELDHPGDRLETKATNACIVMTDYSFNDNDGVVEGTFDILDTPNGRILKSLLDYGCKMGVSSRGEGDVTEVDGQNNIDEDSYYFVAFDAVVLPAVKTAKPALSESVHKRQSLKESLEEQIKAANTISELKTLRNVIEAVEIPESGSLLESVDVRSKELEGVTDSSNLIEDIETLAHQLDDAKQENIQLKESVATYKDNLTKAMNSYNEQTNQLGEYQIQVKELTESLAGKEAELSDALSNLESKSSEVEAIRSQTDGLKVQYDKQIGLMESKMDDCRSLLSEKNAKIRSLIGDLKANESELNSCRASLEESNSTISELRGSVRSLRADVKSLTESNTKLSNDLATANSDAETLNTKWTNLVDKQKTDFAKDISDAKQAVLTECNKKYADLETKHNTVSTQLTEANAKLTAAGKAYTELLNEFINLKAQVNGVNPQEIRESIKPGFTAKDVNSLVESIVDRQDRYRQLPIMSDSVFNEPTASIRSTKTDDEQSRSFMEQILKSL